jgi:hypothetical protein
LIPHVAGLQLPPQGPPHGPAGDLLQRGRDIGCGQILTAQLCMDPDHELRWARSGRVAPLGPDRVHHRCLHLALAQDKRSNVFAARPNIFQMLAGRLPVRTAHQRGSLVQREEGLTVLLHQQPSPDHRQMAMAGGIRQPLGGKLSGPHPNAWACHLHAGPSHVLRAGC